MKTFLLLFSTLILTTHVTGQTDYHPYRLPERTLEVQQIHRAGNVQERVKQGLSDLSTGSASTKEKFATAQAEATEYLHASGYVYNDFEKIEAYLNEILVKIVPKSLMDEVGFKAYLFHDPSINAFTTAVGNIYVQPGLIAECSSEDELALVLAHEVAHRIGHDVYEGFHRKEQMKDRALVASLFGVGFLSYLDFALSMKFDRSQEAEADKVGVDMLCDAGYSVSHGALIFEKFALLEQQWELIGYKKGLGSVIYGSSHPAPEDRLKNILSQCPDIGQAKVSQQFIDARRICRYEVLKMHTEQYDFRAAIIQGWRYLGEAPDTRLEFMTFDALRRLKLLTPTVMSGSIISSAYDLPKDLNTKLYQESASFSNDDQAKLTAALFGSEIAPFEAPLNDYSLTFNELYDYLLPKIRSKEDCDNCRFLVTLDDATGIGNKPKNLDFKSLDWSDDANAFNDYLSGSDSRWLQNSNTLFVVRSVDLTKRIPQPFIIRFENVPLEEALGFMDIKNIATTTSKEHIGEIQFYDQVVAQHKPRLEYEMSNYLRLLEFGQNNASTADLFLVDPRFYSHCKSMGINAIETFDFSGYCTERGGGYFTTSPVEFLTYKNFRGALNLYELESGLKVSSANKKLTSMVRQKTMTKMMGKLYKKL